MARRMKWNVRAFEEIRRSPEVEALLAEEVARIQARVGDGYDGGVESGATRARGYVVTATAEAIEAEASEHRLLSALAGGGLS